MFFLGTTVFFSVANFHGPRVATARPYLDSRIRVVEGSPSLQPQRKHSTLNPSICIASFKYILCSCPRPLPLPCPPSRGGGGGLAYLQPSSEFLTARATTAAVLKKRAENGPRSARAEKSVSRKGCFCAPFLSDRMKFGQGV